MTDSVQATSEEYVLFGNPIQLDNGYKVSALFPVETRPGAKSWLVQAEDPQGKVVASREVPLSNHQGPGVEDVIRLEKATVELIHAYENSNV